MYPPKTYFILCLSASNTIIPVETDAFNESTFPLIGILTKKSQFFFTFSLIPEPSFPITIPIGPC